jgi:hypothetical protein
MQGLIFIPDISGFTNFVKKIDIDLGVSITRDLLTEIIDSNPLDLEISEIEGDAILFYKIGRPIPLSKVFAAFKNIYEAFERRLNILARKYSIEAKLSLKFILHYGNMTIYHIKGFKKLYGQFVIESHRLLKNNSNNSDYILITEDYIKALQTSGSDVLACDLGFNAYASQHFTDLREISYYFFHYYPLISKELKSTLKNIRA